MPTPEQWLEAEKRGLLTPDKQAVLNEARKRGIVPNAQKAAPNQFEAVPTGPGYILDSSGQKIAKDSPDYARVEAEQKAQFEADKTAKEKRLSGRGILERVGDTAAFVGSAIPRALTKGKYGLGDAMGYLVPAPVAKFGANVGKAISSSERDFIEANESELQTAADFGTVMAGVPALNTMGAPLKGMGATAKAVLASPRGTAAGAIRGTGEALEGVSRKAGQVAADETGIKLPVAAGRLGQSLQSTANAMQPKATPLTRQPANQPVLPQNIQTIPERLADIEAQRALGLKPFAPATASKGTARLGRTIEEMYGVGGTVKSPKTDIEIGLRDTQAAMGRQLGSRGSEEQTGAMVQTALERYRGAGLEDLDPSTVKAQGIAPHQPQKRAQVLTEKQAANMTEAAPIRAAGQGGTAQTSRGATVSAAKPLEQIGKRRTNVEDLSDAQLAGLARAPSNQTSFAARGEALYESAWRKIPEIMRKDESANANRTGWKNLQNTLKEIEGETNNQIAGQRTLNGGLAERIKTARSHTSVGELRGIRTELGRALGNFGQFDIGLDRTQLQRLYGATSRDMEAGLMDLANRAWLRTQSKGKDFVKPEIAKKADRALYEFRRADRYFRQGMERMDKFMSVMGAKTPNDAARKIASALKEKTANPQMLREMKGVLREDELNSLRGYVLENLGTARAGAKEAETIFNVNHWATDFHAIMDHPGGKEFMAGLPEGVTQKLKNFARVVDRMKYYESTKNHSGTAYTGIGVVALMSVDGFATAAAMYGGSGLMGKLLTSNAFLAWQEALMKAQLKAGNTAASNVKIAAQYAKRLPALAKGQKDPDLQRALTAIGLATQQHLQGSENQKTRALPAPSVSIP